MALLLSGGLALALSGGPEEPQDDDFFSTAPAFQPYGGQTAGAAAPDRGQEDSPAPRRGVPRAEDLKDAEEEYVYRREDDWRIRENDVIGLEPDGVNIFPDTQGQPISRREVQMRAERELDVLENAEHDFERRLRRRDTAMNSRVFRGTADGRLEVAPGVHVDERVQQQLRRQVARERIDDTVVEDIARRLRAQQPPEEAEYIDDEYYDDEYYDDEYYDDEDW